MWYQPLRILASYSYQFLRLLTGVGSRRNCCPAIVNTLLVIFCVSEVLFGYSEVEGEGLRLGWVCSTGGWGYMRADTRVYVAVGSHDARYVQVPA